MQESGEFGHFWQFLCFLIGDRHSIDVQSDLRIDSKLQFLALLGMFLTVNGNKLHFFEFLLRFRNASKCFVRPREEQ